MDSKLQIISGTYRGRKLNLPPDARPTQNRARIAIFNMLESGMLNNNADMMIWDAFSGSGAFGLECLSRYPNARVLFSDVAPSSVASTRKNLSVLNEGARAVVAQIDAVAAVSKYGTDADLVFLDPPYKDADLGGAFVRQFEKCAKKGAVLVWEQEVYNVVLPNEKKWRILRDKTYGRARFFILEKIG